MIDCMTCGSAVCVCDIKNRQNRRDELTERHKMKLELEQTEAKYRTLQVKHEDLKQRYGELLRLTYRRPTPIPTPWHKKALQSVKESAKEQLKTAFDMFKETWLVLPLFYLFILILGSGLVWLIRHFGG